MKYLKILLIIASSLFLNCKKQIKQNELIVKEFPISQQLKGKEIKRIKEGYPFQIAIFDSLLIIVNKQGDNFFRLYNKNSLDLLMEFGNRGRGPGEFDRPALTGQIIKIAHKSFHLIYDWKMKKISYVCFNDMAKIKSTPYKSELIPEEINDAFRFVYYSDSLSIVVPTGKEELGRFKIYKKGKVDIVDYLPKLHFEVHKNNKYPIYTNVSSAINMEKGIFVATPKLLGEYDFFDISGNFLHTTIIHRDKDLEKASSSTLIFKEPITYYNTEIISSEPFIYSLYTPWTIAEGMANSKVHVLDWEGNPIKEYLLDRPIGSFAIDTIKNCFYGLSYDEKGFSIVKYNLKEGNKM